MSPNKNVIRLKETPPRNDMTFAEVKAALESLGFVVDRINGSHYIFKHNSLNIHGLVVPKPHGKNKCVLRTYIKKIQELINEIEGENNETR